MKVGDLVKVSTHYGYNCVGIVVMVDEFAEECEVMYVSKNDGTTRYTWIPLAFGTYEAWEFKSDK